MFELRRRRDRQLQAAATSMQRTWRGHAARRDVEDRRELQTYLSELYQEEMRAARSIQKTFRGLRGRRHAEHCRIQKLYADEEAKMSAARLEAERLLEEQEAQVEAKVAEAKESDGSGYSLDDEEKALVAEAMRQKLREDRLVLISSPIVRARRRVATGACAHTFCARGGAQRRACASAFVGSVALLCSALRCAVLRCSALLARGPPAVVGFPGPALLCSAMGWKERGNGRCLNGMRGRCLERPRRSYQTPPSHSTPTTGKRRREQRSKRKRNDNGDNEQNNERSRRRTKCSAST